VKKLLILSGKGGTGKTTVAAAFIDFLNARAAADCDVDAPNLHLVVETSGAPEVSDYMGLQKAFIDPEKCTSCGICAQSCRFDAIGRDAAAYVSDPIACEGCGVCLYVCPANAVTLRDDRAGRLERYTGARVFSTASLRMGRGNSGKLVTAVKSALFEAAPQDAVAILDGSPGIGCPVIASVSGADLILIVAEPTPSGMSDLDRLLQTARHLDAKAAVCVNKYDISPENTGQIERMCADLGVAFVGRIPYDGQVSRAINGGHSIARTDCPARTALTAVFEKTMRLLEAAAHGG